MAQSTNRPRPPLDRRWLRLPAVAIADALEALRVESPLQAGALELALAGHTYQSIAAAHNVSIVAVKKALRRARFNLSGILARQVARKATLLNNP